MKLSIEKYINKKFPEKKILKNLNHNRAKWYYDNQKVDAISGFRNIKKYLNKKKNILEVGGGMHFLSNYLAYLGHNIISIEPGSFRKDIDLIRTRILKKKEKNLLIKNITLEKYQKMTNKKFHFIFSINVLEHTKNINKHLSANEKLLKDSKSICNIRCPNYSFPFESHFYVFFIPFFPIETFKIFYEKILKQKYGKYLYNSILNSLNFNCTFIKIKKTNFSIKFLNPIEETFLRIENDKKFKKRILENKFVNTIYKSINFFNLKKLIIHFFPIKFFPYMIINLKKNK